MILDKTDYLKKTKLHLHFHLHLDSDSFGFRKPNPQIFKRVLKHFGVRPEESVMIGDTPSMDISGAKRLRIHTVLINRRKIPFHFNSSTKPEFVITSLRQLEKILKKLGKR